MVHVPDAQETAGLSYEERRAALIVAAVAIILSAGLIPWGTFKTPGVAGLPSSMMAAAVVAMLVTAAILRNQYRATAHGPHAVLAIGYTVTAALMIPYGIIALLEPSGAQLGAHWQTGAWLWLAWHALFVVVIGAYVWADAYFARTDLTIERRRETVRSFGTGAMLLTGALGLALLGQAAVLPKLALHFNPSDHYVLMERVLLGMSAVVSIGLFVRTRLRNPTELWLAVVLLLFVCETFVDGEIVHEPFTLSWYTGMIEGFAWQSILLVVLLQRANEQIDAFVKNNKVLIAETIRDALTGLHNRRGFDEQLEEALDHSRLTGGPVSLLALDLDHFKSYNDHFGHLAGDDALRLVSRAIGSITSRTKDVACRIGGEEFAVVLPGTDEAGAMTVAERVRGAVLHLRMPHAPEAAFGTVTVSIGVAVGDGTMRAVELYERADQALYRAKRLGRNRIVRFTPVADVETLRAV